MRLRSRRKQSHWGARNASAGDLSLICARRSKPYRQLPLDGNGLNRALIDNQRERERFDLFGLYLAGLGWTIRWCSRMALSHEADIAKVQEWLGHANAFTTRL